MNKQKTPLWVYMLLGIIAFFSIYIATNPEYKAIFIKLSGGIGTTLYVSLIAYVISLFLGLLIALLRMSKITIIKEFITLYVELLRSLPMLVVLYYITFIGTPFLVDVYNFVLSPLISVELVDKLDIRDVSYASRAIVALVFGYSVFISENFRAGIESIDKGQWEASRALGLSWGHSMIHVIMPQVFKNILPTLINEFISIIKDSALVSVLGVKDITYLGKTYSATSFKFFETYNVVAFIYLVLVFVLSFFAKKLEERLKRSS